MSIPNWGKSYRKTRRTRVSCHCLTMLIEVLDFVICLGAFRLFFLGVRYFLIVWTTYRRVQELHCKYCIDKLHSKPIDKSRYCSTNKLLPLITPDILDKFLYQLHTLCTMVLKYRFWLRRCFVYHLSYMLQFFCVFFLICLYKL